MREDYINDCIDALAIKEWFEKYKEGYRVKLTYDAYHEEFGYDCY